MTTSSAPKTVKSPRLTMAVILLLFIIDAMGFGLMAPVMPSLIQEVSGQDISGAALWGGILTTCYAVMQFLFAPTIGALSDQYGRRIVIIVSLFVMALDYLVMAVAGSIWLLLVLRLISGVTAANYAVGSALIADISPPEKRAANFGLIGAGFGLGFVIGPVLGGLLAEYGTRAPFLGAAALTALNLVIILFVLPETVTRKGPARWPSWAKVNPLATFSHIARLKGVRALLTILLTQEIAMIVYPAIWSYYTIERFGWSPGQIGISLALFGICMAVVQAGLIRLYLKLMGEVMTIITGLIINIGVFTGMVFVTEGWMALALIPLSSLGAVVLPPLKAMMSRQTPEDIQGALLGVIASTSSVGAIFGPIVATISFNLFTGDDPITYLPGAPFATSALMMCIGLALMLGIARQMRRSTA